MKIKDLFPHATIIHKSDIRKGDIICSEPFEYINEEFHSIECLEAVQYLNTIADPDRNFYCILLHRPDNLPTEVGSIIEVVETQYEVFKKPVLAVLRTNSPSFNSEVKGFCSLDGKAFPGHTTDVIPVEKIKVWNPVELTVKK